MLFMLVSKKLSDFLFVETAFLIYVAKPILTEQEMAHFYSALTVCPRLSRSKGPVAGSVQSSKSCLRHRKLWIQFSSHHLSLNRKGRWGTTDDFATNSLSIFLFSTALWDQANSRPVHSLILSSHLFLCLPCLLPPFTVPGQT